MKFRFSLFPTALLLLLVLSGQAFAATYYSKIADPSLTGLNATHWDTAACGLTAAGSPGSVAATDSYVICGSNANGRVVGAIATLTGGVAVTTGTITIESGASVTLSGAITSVPTITVNSGGYLISANAAHTLTFNANANLVNNGIVTLSAAADATPFIILSGTGVYSGTGRLDSHCATAVAGAWDTVAGGAATTTWAVYGAPNYTACNVRSAVATGVPIPGAGSRVSIGFAITAPVSVGPFTIASLVFTAGTLTFTGKTLNVSGTAAVAAPGPVIAAVAGNVTTTNGVITIGTGGVLNVAGTVTGTGAITTGTNGTLNVTGDITTGAGAGGAVTATSGTIGIGANLDDTQNQLPTANMADSLLKLTDTNHTITVATAAKTFPVVDVSAFTGPTTTPAVASKVVTFLGAFNNVISTLVLPTAGLTAKEVKFAVPAGQTLTISAMSVSTMTCVGAAAADTVTGTAAAPVLNATGAAAGNFTCTIAASTTATSAPIFSTKEKAKVFVEEVNN
jgi:hypothetical protein